MRHVITVLFLFVSIVGLGQNKGKFSLLIQANPEWTFYKNDYAYRWGEKYTKTTVNTGFSSSLQYYLTNNIFVSAGLGYIERKFETKVFLDQAAIPPPQQSWTQELVTAKFVSYRTLFLPVDAGYIFVKKKKLTSFALCEISGNYQLNATYDVNFNKYDGTYNKNYWQGVSLNVGAGTEYKIFKNINLSCSITYSLINDVRGDTYLFSQDEYQIPLTHRYLKLGIGIKMLL